MERLNYNQDSLRSLITNLRILQAGAENTGPAEISRSNRGAPKKVHIERISDVVAEHYFGLTGKAPTVICTDGVAYGAFVKLLGDIFAILAVDASAESQARSAIKRVRGYGI